MGWIWLHFAYPCPNQTAQSFILRHVDPQLTPQGLVARIRTSADLADIADCSLSSAEEEERGWAEQFSLASSTYHCPAARSLRAQPQVFAPPTAAACVFPVNTPYLLVFSRKDFFFSLHLPFQKQIACLILWGGGSMCERCAITDILSVAICSALGFECCTLTGALHPWVPICHSFNSVTSQVPEDRWKERQR